MYFYRLGHIPHLSLAELDYQQLALLWHTNQFAVSNHDIDIQKLGGVSWKAENIEGKNFLDAVSHWIETASERTKFVGISLPKQNTTTEAIRLLKQKGAKKVAFIDDTFTIGDWKRSDVIFLECTIENKAYFLKVTDFFDQDKWAKLENSLPVTDMKRGQINIKLARVLKNLTNKTSIIDPFCGIGRNAIACLDLISSAYLSDLDTKAVLEAEQNCNYAQTKLQTNVPIHFTTKDASELSISDSSRYAVVSEGWLGLNLQTHPSPETAKKSIEQVIALYQKCFENWAKAGISEIVICAPFYPTYPSLTPTVQQSIRDITKKTGYTLSQFGDGQFIRYARPKTYVGHLIFKAILQA